MIDSVFKTIEKYNMISKGDRIVVAVSGGPDSMALLYFLYTISEQYSLYIHAAHLNHMLRGEESDQDTLYVEDFCKKHNIPCTVRYVDVYKLSQEKGLSLEEAGREARYGLFLDILKEINGNKIALAHNLNDQAETILMRIMRGTGLDGLCGIKPVRDNLYIRPLINTCRRDIEKYCQEHGLLPRIDSTNLEPIYTRNKIRLELIPYIKENYNPGIESSISSMSELLREDNEFLEGYVDDVYNDLAIRKDNKDKVSINVVSLDTLHNAIKKRVIRRAIEDVKGNLVGIESRHIELILSIVKLKTTGRAVQLPGNIEAFISYENLNISKCARADYCKFFHDIAIPGITLAVEISGEIEAQIFDREKINYNDKNEFVKYFDYDKIKYKLILRNRQEGDYIVPLGMKGRKKIKDLFIDMKIPREERNMVPLIAAGSEIIWVIGYKLSDSCKITPDTKKILRLEYRKLRGNNNVK